MPGPVSVTAISTWPSSVMGVREEVEDDLADTALIGGHGDLLRLRLEGEVDAAMACPFRVQGDRAAQQLRDLHLRELHTAGLDLGKAEHVVDQREQLLAARTSSTSASWSSFSSLDICS